MQNDLAGLDYNATTTSLALTPQSVMKSLFVGTGIIDDNTFERSETFTGRLIATDILPGTIYLEPTIAAATTYDHKSICMVYDPPRLSYLHAIYFLICSAWY